MRSVRLSRHRSPWFTAAPEVTTRRRFTDNLHGEPIRLSKRLSELGICSRREAAAILNEVAKSDGNLRHVKEVIYLNGKPVTDGAAVKVAPDERYIEIRAGDDPPLPDQGNKEFVPYPDRPWEEIMGDTIVLHKPIGYVSGQEEHQHVPAVRLLTRRNMLLTTDSFNDEMRRAFRDATNGPLNFDKWRFAGYDTKSNSIPKCIRETLDNDELHAKQNSFDVDETLSGYAPAGRLDIDSTGVILFTRAGIMARRLIEPESKIAKEYIVTVQPAVQLTAREAEMGLQNLPRPTRDLSKLLKKGNSLVGSPGHLKPLLAAEWLDDNRMRLVLNEGKKRQIRRMCRELIGWHVVNLVRTSVGPVKIDMLPEGKWRPLTQSEVTAIFDDQPKYSQSSSTSNDKFRDDSFESASSSDIGGSFVSTLAKRGITEKQVKRKIIDALRKDAGPEGLLSITKLVSWVGKSLSFTPKEEGKRNKWKDYLLQVCRAHPKNFVMRGTQHVGLSDRNDRTSTVEASKRVDLSIEIAEAT
jgi:23S rRNA pseudouridine2604 synthase